MSIYQVGDIINQQVYYFVANTEVQQEGQALNVANSIWTVGDITAANTQLANSQTIFLSSPQAFMHFSQVKSVGQDAEGHNIWSGCNILTEEPNTTILYELFSDVQGGFQQATGTSNALQVYETQQQALLSWAGLSSVITLDKLPTPPKPKANTANT
jgi:hypothetical protein